MKLITLTLHDDDEAIYIVVDKIIAFARPGGKQFTEVFVQQTVTQCNTTLGPCVFRVKESPGNIADLYAAASQS